MKRILVGFSVCLVSICLAVVYRPAWANPCPSYPFTLTNGTTADANQVMGNFNTIMNCASFFVGGTSSGSASAQTLSSVSPGVFTLTNGNRVTFIAGFTTTGATTLDVASTGATNVLKKASSGLVSLGAGDMVANQVYTVQYDGTQYQLLDPVGGAGKPWSCSLVTSSMPSFAIPAGTTELTIEAWAGGASGGGQSGGTQRGGGGGGGQYLWHYRSGTMDTSLNITIGSGGAPASAAAGNAGGNTSIVGTNLGTLVAHGGSGPPAPGVVGGGIGGTGATNATFAIDGQDGQSSAGTTATVPLYGVGGSAPRGGPGGQSNVAAAGKVPGGGGAGENHVGGGSGAGARGQVNICIR